MRVAAAVVCAMALSGCVVATEVQQVGPRSGASDAPASPSRSAPASTPTGSMPPTDGSYRFLHTRGNGTPVRWSTCEPIRYVVRPDNAPPEALDLLGDSLAAIADATGLAFVDEGTTDEPPSEKRPLYQPRRYGEQWAPVLVAFSTPAEYPPLAGSQAGYGGAVYVDSGRAAPRYVSGMVIFDGPQLDRFRSESRVRAVMVHELAHLVGLGHVDDPQQLMYRVQRPGDATTLQEGDRAGLREVGRGRCLPPLEPQRVAAELDR